MAISVVMPALEMAQETGKLVSWMKAEGEAVRKGEMLLEVETDKAVVEVEAAADGVLAGVVAAPGDVVPVGQVIAWLLKEGESVPAASVAVPTGRHVAGTSSAATPTATIAPAAAAPGAPRLSPRARRLAQERGVDLSRIAGSGPGGEILADDILAASVAAAPAGSPAVEALSSVGRLMAERTLTSWTTVPHFFVTRHVQASALVAARARLGSEVQAEGGIKLTVTDLLVSGIARVLRAHPRLTASWTPDGIVLHDEVNVALAVAVDQAVAVMVLRSADRAPLVRLAAERDAMTQRARANRLTPSDLTGGTFTISNLGMYGVDAFTAIVVPPQAAILAVGAVADRVVAIDGRAEVRPMMTLTLSSDHRVVDGARAAAFMADVVKALESEGTWAP